MIKQILDSYDANHCKEILAIASVVYRPITLVELRVLAKLVKHFSQNNLEKVIALCGSFLILRGGIISFVHQSAKDYLLREALVAYYLLALHTSITWSFYGH